MISIIILKINNFIYINDIFEIQISILMEMYIIMIGIIKFNDIFRYHSNFNDIHEYN